MAGGGPLPVREYTDADAMRRRAADLRQRCFAPRPPAAPSAPRTVVREVSGRAYEPEKARITALVEAAVAQYGKPDLRTPEQRAGKALYSGRHCLLAVVAVTDMPAQVIAGRGMDMETRKARWIASYLMRHYAGKSTPQIGHLLGRDHSTVVHALRRVDRAVSQLGLGLLATPDDMAEALWLPEWPDDQAYRAKSRDANLRQRGLPPC